MTGVAGLDEFLGDDAQAALHKLTGVPGGAIAFPASVSMPLMK